MTTSPAKLTKHTGCIQINAMKQISLLPYVLIKHASVFLGEDVSEDMNPFYYQL